MAEPTEAVAETMPEPTEAVADMTEEPAVAVAAVAVDADPETEFSVAEEHDPMDVFAEDRPAWDIPEPFEFDDYESVDDRPTDMFASYDDIFPVVTAAAAAATSGPTAETEQGTAEASAIQDPDDAMAPVLNDVDQGQMPNWTLWQPPVDAADRPVNQPAFVGKVVGPTPPDELFEGTDDSEEPSVSDPAQTTAQVIGATIATEVGDAVVHQVPALYSTAPYGIQQPLVVRIELTIVDETNKLRAAEMARPVGPWSDVPADTEEFDDDMDDQVMPQGRAASPPSSTNRSHWDNPMQSAPPARQASDPGASAWAIPALDDERPVNGRATKATWTPVDHDDPLADLPAAPYEATGQARAAATAQASTQAQPAWFDSAAPVRKVNAGAARAQASRSASDIQPASGGDQSDLWFLASEPDGYVADQPATDKSESPRVLMAAMTVLMAAAVVLLALVFIQLMTSLLK
jgi:hypothetical protein